MKLTLVIQPTASYFTDWAIPALKKSINMNHVTLQNKVAFVHNHCTMKTYW
jgi:hypothetical protein